MNGPTALTTSALSSSEPPPVSTHSGGFSLTPLWALYILTMRQYGHGKRWMVMAALMFLPAVLALLVRSASPDVPGIGHEFLFVFMLISQALLPLAALIYASGMIQDELEDQTITYLLIRPIPRWALYLVKLLATLTATIFLTFIFTILTYAAIYIGAGGGGQDIPLRCLKAACIHSLAMATYCCLFGLMGLLTKRILIVGILYLVVFEGLFANLAFSIRLITVIYYSRIIAYRSMPFIVSTPFGPRDFAADAWQLDVANDPTLSQHPSLFTCIAVLVLSSLVFASLAAFICSQREFHVKTPEKG